MHLSRPGTPEHANDTAPSTLSHWPLQRGDAAATDQLAATMPIHLYIEHLLNIRTLSIHASLPTSSRRTARATISADKSILTLTHDGETASIKLPLNLSPNKESTISLDIPPVPQKELSFRVQLEEKEGSELSYGLEREDGITTPWTADQLTAETEICCKACQTVVLERGKISQWKDLPSEGWAEMMDFWHCHKPDHSDGPHAHGADAEINKGYAAGSRLALGPGVGMVDALNFVFTAEDCTNLKVGALFLSSPPSSPTVRKFLFIIHGPKRTGAPAPQGKSTGQQSGYNRSKSNPFATPRLASTWLTPRSISPGACLRLSSAALL